MLQQEDRNEFVKDMMKEIVDHESRKYWYIMRRTNLPIRSVSDFLMVESRNIRLEFVLMVVCELGRNLLGNICSCN